MAPYAKAELKWHEVEKRIDFLISHNQFLSDHDRAVDVYKRQGAGTLWLCPEQRAAVF